MHRRDFLATLAATAAAATGPALMPGRVVAAECVAPGWPLWDLFKRFFLAEDGRVIDASVPELHSTSEGQSYGMFFALVANDRAAFDHMWRWSIDNLMGGDAESRLPAWRWGKRPDGTWGELDGNAAADADLWFAYSLLEAARLWSTPAYAEQARALLARVVAEEVVTLPGAGRMLLPGPIGFARDNQVWRLNPSYQPVPLLRLLARQDAKGPWAEIATGTARMIADTAPRGVVADWVAYQGTGPEQGHYAVDPDKGDVGSYDAIRVYLWAGITPAADPLARPILESTSGMARITQNLNAPPEYVSTISGGARGTQNFGFAAALLPYLNALGQDSLAATLRERVLARIAQDTAAPAGGPQPPYYDYMLSLFALGHTEQQYRFLPSGALQTSWEKTCRRAYRR